MDAKKYARKTLSVILFFLSLLVLLGGYLASYESNSGLFLAAGIVSTIAIVIAASVLWEQAD